MLDVEFHGILITCLNDRKRYSLDEEDKLVNYRVLSPVLARTVQTWIVTTQIKMSCLFKIVSDAAAWPNKSDDKCLLFVPTLHNDILTRENMSSMCNVKSLSFIGSLMPQWVAF